MGLLILDTDKKSTASLRLQLSSAYFGELAGDRRLNRGIREIANIPALLGSLKAAARSRSMPDLILVDQDGDAALVDAFYEEIKYGRVSCSVMAIGSARRARYSRVYDTYLRKPVFPTKLVRALDRSYHRNQSRQWMVGCMGPAIPPGLVRAVGKAQKTWKQLVKVEPGMDAEADFNRIGVLFVSPEALSEKDLSWLRGIYRAPSRCMIVGLGKKSEETHALRNLADYFVSSSVSGTPGMEAEWENAISSIAVARWQRFQSTRLLARAGKCSAKRKYLRASILLRKILIDDPWNLRARFELGEIALERKRYSEAVRHYVRVLKLNPCQPRPYLRLMEIERLVHQRVAPDTLARARLYCPKLRQLEGLD